VFYGAVFLRQRALLTSRPTGGEAIAVLRRVPGLIGLGLLIVLTLVVCCLPGVVFAFPGAGLAAKTLMALVVLVALSYVLIAVSCAVTIFYVDGSGATESFLRSWRLTAGNFWRLSVVYTVALIILFVVDALVMGVTGFIGGVMGHADLAVVAALIGVVGVALGAFITPFYTALGLAVLGDLSARKEGADLERRIAAS
jgi:antibiotic biosynthesis monooxygenase (ABM) superfamily enzyme